MEAFKQSVTVC